MGKKSKRNNKKRRLGGSEPSAKDTPSSSSTLSNPLLDKLNAFLNTLSETERSNLFSSSLSPERRGEIWMQQAELGESLVQQYAWATPDARAMAILKHFSPVAEIGCGANAYWCQQMVQHGIDVVGFDRAPDRGGQIGEKTTTPSAGHFAVRKGGPEVLAKHSDRTLFLCYPDEDDYVDPDYDVEEDGPPMSTGAQCLQHYEGDHVIHVGELFLDATLSIDQAPWGRSSSPEFQQMLAAEFHCILHVRLPSWLHTKDSLSVWKRSEKCSIVFAADDEDDEDEEFEYRHIPIDEQLPIDIAAPCLQHLLKQPAVIGSSITVKPSLHTVAPNVIKSEVKQEPQNVKAGSSVDVKKATAAAPSQGNKKRKKKKKTSHHNDKEIKSATAKGGDYECPW